jgi:protein TonB
MVRVMADEPEPASPTVVRPRPEAFSPIVADEQVPDFKAVEAIPLVQRAAPTATRLLVEKTAPVKVRREHPEQARTDSGPSKPLTPAMVSPDKTPEKAATSFKSATPVIPATVFPGEAQVKARTGSSPSTMEISSGRAGVQATADGNRWSSGPAAGPAVASVAGRSPTAGPFYSGQVDRVPEATERPRPAYPRGARRRGVQGWVKVRFMVDSRGLPGQVQVVESSPSGVFDDSVLETLPRWRFVPGLKDGRTVDTWVVTSVRFELTD